MDIFLEYVGSILESIWGRGLGPSGVSSGTLFRAPFRVPSWAYVRGVFWSIHIYRVHARFAADGTQGEHVAQVVGGQGS